MAKNFKKEALDSIFNVLRCRAEKLRTISTVRGMELSVIPSHEDVLNRMNHMVEELNGLIVDELKVKLHDAESDEDFKRFMLLMLREPE